MPSIFAAVAVVSSLLPLAFAQAATDTPLASKHFTYTALVSLYSSPLIAPV